MKLHTKSILFVWLLLTNIALSSAQQTLVGYVIKIVDGDTYDILVDKATHRVRMASIDAPERGMPFSKEAKQYLAGMCFNKNIKITFSKRDRSNRIIAFSYLEDGRELSAEMIKAGFAWHYLKYSNDAVFNQLEQRARQNKVGLWFDPYPLAPWDHRKQKRNKI
jgi:endonuclease YncB( thermonuclease family)